MQKQNSENFSAIKIKEEGGEEMVKKTVGTEKKVGHVLRTITYFHIQFI